MKRKSRKQDASTEYEAPSRKIGGRSKAVERHAANKSAPSPRSYGSGRGARQSGGIVP
jgi:hypothetical protein